jgi:CRISPR system Cascade subunit CasA
LNIIDDPCLQVTLFGTAAWGLLDAPATGHIAEVSARRLLLDAHLFADLVVDIPTQKPALLRQLLLPIVVDALGWPADAEEWAAWFSTGAFTQGQRDRLGAYLDERLHLFELFGTADPFGQVAGLRTAKDETKSASLLVATAATGNNVPLFASRTEADRLELTPAQALRWLLHTHCWDTAAIKTGVVGDPRAVGGKTSGNPTGPLGQLGVIVPTGRTLFETLLLNIPCQRRRLADDLPQWRRRATDGPVEKTLSVATPAWQIREARGTLDLWTWQSRRVRLIPEATAGGLRVTQAVVAAGDRLTSSPSPDVETHTAWSLPRPGGGTVTARRRQTPRKAPDGPRPRRHQAGRAGWRGLASLLAIGGMTEESGAFATSSLLTQLAEVSSRLAATFPLQVELTGISYGNQSAVIEDVIYDSIPLPIAALAPGGLVYGALLGAVEQAEDLAEAVNRLSADLRRAAGSDPIPWDKGQRPGDVLLYALDPIARRLLVELRGTGDDFDAVDKTLGEWEQKAAEATWRVAEQVLSAVPPTTFVGRAVTKDGKERVYRLSTAERAFRTRINDILARRAARRTD